MTDAPKNQTSAREQWFGRVQSALEALMDDAPDETCRTIVRNFLEDTYEWTDESYE